MQKLSGLELAAVAARDQKTADAAAQEFAAKSGYGNAAEMFKNPYIDIISVCVTVPDHRELVLGALAGGKHVYCEWPLGGNLAESEEMAKAAKAAGLHTAIGLQLRKNLAVVRARNLIASGAIGRLLSASIYSSTAGFGPIVPKPYLYLEEPKNGVNMVTVQAAHTIDFAIAVLGELADLAALNTRQYPEIEAGDDHKRQARTTFDHVLVQARMMNGAALAIEVAGGRPPATPSHLQAVADKGVLVLQGGAPRGFQSGRLKVFLNGELQHVDEGELASMPDEAASVAGVYGALRDDILNARFTVPDFDHAVRLTRLVDAKMLSSENGIRQRNWGWPYQL
ncbi:MAG: Gfo/Idh/MocA family oxidoreductase [Acidobacteriota bacterium]|nr:Gfo/Idh/MocA family oxidoreductase [Acidobacteriota bacterium]